MGNKIHIKLGLWIILSLLLTEMYRCKNNTEASTISKDTLQIFRQLLSQKAFTRETLGLDTLFFIKNKFYNKSWPVKVGKFKLVFIEDSPKARMFNIGKNYPADGRLRYTIEKIRVTNDSAFVGLMEHGGRLYFDFILAKENDNWVVLKANSEPMGRIEKFDFETQQWYLDLKKKMK